MKENWQPDIYTEQVHKIQGIDLDPHSVVDLARMAEYDTETDVLVGDARFFKKAFLQTITQSPEKQIYFGKMGTVDKKGIYRGDTGVVCGVGLKPQIIGSDGAGPCSLVIAHDSEGSAGIVHISQYNIFDENPDIRAKANDLSKRYFTSLNEFSQNNLTGDRKLLITGTNVDRDLRDAITASIHDTIEGFETSQMFSIFVNPTTPLMVSRAGYKFTQEMITGVYVMPSQLTKDGRNKILLVGGNPHPDDQGEIEANEWRMCLNNLYPERHHF
jgi:hypothetical protein